jgi:hypothetical protein
MIDLSQMGTRGAACRPHHPLRPFPADGCYKILGF